MVPILFDQGLSLIEQGKLNLDPMIADRFPLTEAPRAFARAEERGTLKVLLESTPMLRSNI